MIAVSKLDLDCENPRHGAVGDQDAALARLIVDQRDKLVRLAVDIHDNGLSPSQLFIVKREDSGRFTVLDGNRRLAALRILEDPARLPARHHTQEFTRVVSEASTSPDEVMCVVVPNRDEARLWLDRIHSGQMAGIGNVPWSAAAKYRFNPNPSSRTHTASAIIVLDWLRQRLPANDAARTQIDEVESDNPTTFGRLAQDPNVRGWIGFEFQAGTVALNDDEAAVIRRLLKIIEKLAGDVTVTQLKKKRDRANFIAELLPGDTFGLTSPAAETDPEEPEETPGEDRPAAATDGPAEEPEPGESGGTADRPQQPAHPYADIDIAPLHPRIQQIVAEVRKLNPDRYPNAAAALHRVVIELSVTDYLHRKGKTQSPNVKLKNRVRNAMAELGIADNDDAFRPLRTQLADRDSIISVPSLHQFLHNANAAPGRSDLNSIAIAYRPLLAAICADLRTQSP